MTTANEIPLLPTPQTLSITLGGTSYNLLFYWCQPSQCWVMDIFDVGGNAILCGSPLITGADLLAQFAYLMFGGELIVQTDHDTDAVPTFTNLGSTGHLYFVAP